MWGSKIGVGKIVGGHNGVLREGKASDHEGKGEDSNISKRGWRILFSRPDTGISTRVPISRVAKVIVPSSLSPLPRVHLPIRLALNCRFKTG